MTGWFPDDLKPLGGRPSIGAAITKLRGPVDPACLLTSDWLRKRSTHLGLIQEPLDSSEPLIRRSSRWSRHGQHETERISLERLQDRRQLLTSIDTLRRDIDTKGSMQEHGCIRQRALDVLTSSKLLDALDLSKEDPKVVARYGDGKPYKYQYDGAPTCNDHLLIARRLVEAGARCVSLSFGRWDSHGQNFDLVRDHGGKLDQCLSALIEDLDQRGILNDVSVVVWGEFGRTPKINNGAGRDHWSNVSCAFLAAVAFAPVKPLVPPIDWANTQRTSCTHARNHRHALSQLGYRYFDYHVDRSNRPTTVLGRPWSDR